MKSYQQYVSFTKHVVASLLIALMTICINQSIVYSQPINVLHSFNHYTCKNPCGSLMQASDGNFYGTSESGGYYCGTLYKYNKVTKNVTILHNFGDFNVVNDGKSPHAALIQGPDGDLYGTTASGGSVDQGTIYKYNIAQGNITILHSFRDGSILDDGAVPTASLLQASDGNLYGTTSSGGSAHYGAIYKYNIATKTVTILHSFKDGSVMNDGYWPYASLIQGNDSYLYGTTENGGLGGSGTIYRYNITDGSYTILHSFLSFDGQYPRYALLQGTDGNLFGTTRAGGSVNSGTIYKYNVATGNVSVVHNFGDNSTTGDGNGPYASLTQGADGNLYGTTYNGGYGGATDYGLPGYGTIYQYNITTGSTTILHKFNDGAIKNDGTYPYGALTQGADGNLYGTTYSGGSSGIGTIFEYDQSTQTTILLSDFVEGTNPRTSVIQGADGCFYGTTLNGGANGYGTIYKYDPSVGSTTVLYSFTISAQDPYAALIQAPDGNLYGTTTSGGNGILSAGTIYQFNIGTGKLTILHSFLDGSITNDGAVPYSALLLTSDNNLYGTTYNGGANGYGTIYRYNIATGGYTVLHSFKDSSVTNDGYYPTAALIQASDGDLYGTTTKGGTSDGGVIFKYNIASGNYTILHNFWDGSVTQDGWYPYAALIQGTDGNLYGTTTNGGISGYGTIYRYSISTGSVTILHRFNDGTISNDGYHPYASLLETSDGSLYGTTYHGGSWGTVYKFNVTTGIYTILHSFINSYIGSIIADGANPYASLIQATDGNLYGTTYYGGKYGDGTIYKLNISKTLLTSSLNPSIEGQSVTFYAAVNGNSPTGTVQFVIDGVNAGSPVALISGSASYTTSGLSVGSHTITAVYNGDTNNIDSTSNIITQTVIPLAITSLSPSTIPGATTFTLTVNGTGFVNGSVIKWNGTNLATTYVSPTQLTASINKYNTTLASYPGTATVSVLNPDGGRSAGATLTITQPIPVPTITSLSPSTVSGAKTFTLTVNGTNFVSGSVIKWNGTNMTTTYVSPTQLTASINKYYTTLASYPGTASISVLNPDGNRSAGATLNITAPLPVISSLSPASVQGATTFTLTVNGSNFVNGSIIKWNGTNMTTTFVSATQLTASINKYYDTLASYPGSATVSVLNPDGGRSTGSAITITQPITPPAITSLSPSSVTGATTFTLTVNGTDFQSDAVIKWNGTNMTTTFVSSTQVTAVINKYYTTLASYPGSATVSVLNPDSGRSAGASLAITQP